MPTSVRWSSPVRPVPEDLVSSPLPSAFHLFLVVSRFCLPASLTPLRFLFFSGSRKSFSRSSRTVLPSLDVHFESCFPFLFLLSSTGGSPQLRDCGISSCVRPGPCVLAYPASCRGARRRDNLARRGLQKRKSESGEKEVDAPEGRALPGTGSRVHEV